MRFYKRKNDERENYYYGKKNENHGW